MTNLEIADRFAEMWRRSREDAGKSQAFMAKALGVSRATIQHWEEGVSSPSQAKGFQWFEALGLQPMPYYMELIYGISNESDPLEGVGSIAKDLPTEYQRKILFFLSGKHGSSVAGIIELMTAYLMLPLRDRLAIAQSIATMYRVVDAEGSAMADECIRPNMDILQRSIDCGTRAVLSGEKEYSQLPKEVDE